MRDKIAKCLGWTMVEEDDQTPYQVGWYVSHDGKTAYSPDHIDQILTLLDKEISKAVKAKHRYLDGMTDYDKGYIDGQHIRNELKDSLIKAQDDRIKQLEKGE